MKHVLAWTIVLCCLSVCGRADAQHFPAFDHIPLTEETVVSVRAGGGKTTITYYHFGGGSPVAREANRQVRAYADQEARDFRAASDALLQAHGYPPGTHDITENYVQTARQQINLAQPFLISMNMDSRELLYAGLHRSGLSLNVGRVYGKVKNLTLQDLFRPGVDGVQIASVFIIARMRKNRDADFVRTGRITQTTSGLTTHFALTQSNITFWFPPSVMGTAYVYGASISIPYSDFGDALDRNGPLRLLWKHGTAR